MIATSNGGWGTLTDTPPATMIVLGVCCLVAGLLYGRTKRPHRSRNVLDRRRYSGRQVGGVSMVAGGLLLIVGVVRLAVG
jgi:hypothetical protein